MDNDELALQITVAYKSGMFTQVPHLLTVTDKFIALKSTNETNQTIFNVPLSQVQKLVLTPMTISFNADQQHYKLATCLSSGRWIRGPGGKPKEFTLRKGLRKNKLARKYFKTHNITFSDYTLILEIGYIIFMLFIILVVFLAFS